MMSVTEQEISKMKWTLETIEDMMEKINVSKNIEEYEALSNSKWLILNQIRKLENI